MKKHPIIITIILTLFSLNILAQTTLEINKEKKGFFSADKIINGLDKASLPLIIKINKDYNEEKINLITQNGIVKEGQFKKNQEYYEILIDENRVIKVNSDSISELQGSILNLNIGNKITYKIKILDNQEPTIIEELKTLEPHQPQIYYDAIMLSQGTLSPNDKKHILKAYGIIENNIGDNPFLLSFSNEMFGSNSGLGINSNNNSFAPINLKSIGNLDVTTIAWGMAKFLAERTKDEINEFFFERMKKELGVFPELNVLFPNTTKILNIVESYAYASVIQVLKESFDTDIQQLPVNLINFTSLKKANCQDGDEKCETRLEKLGKLFSDKVEGKQLALGFRVIKESYDSENPASLLDNIINSNEFKKLRATLNSDSSDHLDILNFLSSVEVANVISQSLRSSDENRVWITNDEFKELFKGNNFKYFMGLVYQKIQNDALEIKYLKKSNETFKETDFLQILKGSEPEINKIETLLKDFYQNINTLNIAINNIITAKEKFEDPNPKALYDYYKMISNSTKSVLRNELIGKYISTNSLKFIEEVIDPSADIIYNISSKKYSSAIYSTTTLLSNIDKDSSFKDFIPSFVKYGTLISSVASAETPEEVTQALQASTLPVGSYSIKRKAKRSLSINSFVGMSFNLNSSFHFVKNNLISLTAPIGVNKSYTWETINKKGKKILTSVGLNFFLFDLGTLVNYYYANNDSLPDPNDFKVKLGNIISPGFNVSYNIPRAPVTLSLGVRYVSPIENYYSSPNNTENEYKKALHFNLSLLMDIPLFNLWVKN